MRKYFLLLSSLLFMYSAAAQTPAGYSEAKNQLNQENYWEAMELFKEFLNADEYGNLSNFAAFHLAEAALGANRPEQAVEALLPLVSKTWRNQEEAKYLLALAYFDNSEPEQALAIIKKIENEEILKMAENATFENLKDASPSFMISNLREYKENQGYSAAMKVVLESQTILSASERAAYYELQDNSGSARNVVKNDVLDLFVILPFTGSGNSAISGISANDFVFELYQGIELGIAKLERDGVRVSLQTFDSKRDLDHLQNLLRNPAFLSADAIIGPIYQDESDLVSAFAESSNIPFIHPLSNLGERFEGMKNSFLFRPSVNSLADGIVEGLKNQSWGKRVAIGYSSSSRDELLAKALEEKLRQDGFQLIENQVINPRNISQFLRDLGIRSGRESRDMKVDQVILLADDPSIAQPAFSLLESVNASIPTLVMDSWLGFNFANYEMLEFPNFYFISNNTPNFYAKSMRDFSRSFYEKYLSFPSINAGLGVELVYWLSENMSASKGFDLRRNLDQNAFQQGVLSWGFNFQNSNNNQYVPVFKLESGELKPLE